MTRRRSIAATLCTTLFVLALAGANPAGAVPPDPLDDGSGKQWRQLYETTGLSWSQVAQICPRDGATPCSGTAGARVLTGWVWATAAQVVALMGAYESAILTADPPSVSGGAYFGSASAFLTDMRWTGYFVTYGGYSEWTGGWTSSRDGAGLPVAGVAGYGWWPPGGSFGVSGVDDVVDSSRGVWLWRPSAGDHTPPVITPSVTGTSGNNGWFVSDVSVAWDVQDAESPVTSQAGCEPATVTSDTAGTTFACEATSAGGTSTASAVVKRDTTAPTVTCASPTPVFEIYQIGAWVSATVADATSGPASPVVQGATNTGTPGTFTTTVTGADRAGNTTTKLCSYQVVVPTCRGLTPTRVGTAANDVINGTGGRDIIVALGGGDTVYGKGGDDVICGGDGPDTVDGGAGNDWIDGGASPDELLGGGGDDYLDGGAGNDSLRGGNGRDTCTSGEVRMSSCEL